MLLKSSSRNPSPLGLAPKRLVSRTPTSFRTQSPCLKKKFTPTVNKSFTCYKEKAQNKHSRASSLDKSKENNSTMRRSKNRSLRFNTKIFSQPKEISIDYAKSQMELGNYAKAIEILNTIMRSETENCEFLYSRGVCFMHLHQYKLAIDDLLKVADKDPIFDKQLYIALYMCYMSSNQFVLALRALSRGVRKFPNFIQAYMFRGQLLNKLGKYDKAIKDFKKILSIDKQELGAVFCIGESFIGMKDWENAIKALDSLVLSPEYYKKSLLLKTKALYEVKNFDEALEELEKVINNWPEEAVAHYYKAKINYELRNFPEAALCFEQAIQGSSDPETINSSVFYLGSIKIKERDFYGALHTFERAVKAFVTPNLKALNAYTEGIVCLMKRKLEEGITVFNELLKMKEPVLKEFRVSCYESLGFAYFSLNKYDLAVNMLLLAKKYGKIDTSSEFNYIISEAILAYEGKQEAKALKILKGSKGLFPKNPMPVIIRACILMHQSFRSDENLHMLIKSELLIDKIVKTREPESEILFYRSILKLCLKNFDHALENSKRAIEKADENLAKHYIQRGYCHALLKKYEDAVNDFTIALQLNDNIKEVYAIRGISAYLQDDLQLAFDDFTSAAKKYSDDSDFLIRMAKYLILVGSYTDSLSILDSNLKISLDRIIEVEYLKVENYIFLSDFPRAVSILNGILELDPQSQEVSTDIDIINFLIKIKKDPQAIFNSMKFCSNLKENTGHLFNKKYSYWIIGVLLYYTKDYTAASSYFQAVLEVLHSEEPEVFADSITIEEENCEILYNIALCSLTGGCENVNSHALMIFEELAEVLNTKHKGQLLFLSALIHLAQKNKTKAEKLMKEAAKCDNDTVSPFLNNQTTTVLPLHTSSDFASFFPLVAINIDNLPSVYIRPSVVLPRLTLDIKMSYVCQQVLSFYTINTVIPRAEAPWLVRSHGSIQFTDAIIEVYNDVNETEKSTDKLESENTDDKRKNHEDEGRKKGKSQIINRQRTFQSEEFEKKDMEEE